MYITLCALLLCIVRMLNFCVYRYINDVATGLERRSRTCIALCNTCVFFRMCMCSACADI